MWGHPTDHQPGSGGGTSLRLFAGIPVPTEPASRLADFGEVLVSRGAATEAVGPEAQHVTFAFLGDVAEELVPAVAAHLDDAARQIAGATSCHVSGIGSFGSDAVAVHVTMDLLVLLNAARDTFLTAVAPWAPGRDTRAWQPHVVVARSTEPSAVPDTSADQVPAASWVASDLVLYASLPGMSQRQHKALHVASFGEIATR